MENYVTAEQVGEYLSLSKSTVLKYAKLSSLNGFPCHRVGNHWRFKLSEIELWMQREALARGRKDRDRLRSLGL